MNFDKDTSIVITGGAGFIGSAVIRHLNNQGIDRIIVVDDLGSSNKWKNLVGKKILDIISKNDLFDFLKGKEDSIEAFIHLGACSSTIETNASYLLENNYRYSVKLAEYALKHNHRFIYASSAATYGDGTQGFSDNDEDLEKLYPLNMYGYSKQLFDLWLKQENLLSKVVGLKYFNVFGPNEYHKGRMASAIIKMLPMAQKEGKIELFASSDKNLYADGEQKRDFVYVKDVAAMTTSFLSNDATGVFNIGSGRATSWNEMAEAVFAAIEKPVNIQYIPTPSDIIGYQNFTRADMKKTRNALGEVANCRPFKESVIDYIRNYLILGKTW